MRKYQTFDRTRLFGPEWHITQQWTTIDVPWSADYSDTKFNVTLEKTGPIVIVLSQVSLKNEVEFLFLFLTIFSWMIVTSEDLKDNTTLNCNSGLKKREKGIIYVAATETTP